MTNVVLRNKVLTGTKYNHREQFIPQVGLTYVRGCEIEGMLDQSGRVIEEGPEPKPQLPGEKRTFRVWLDCNQYCTDMDLASHGKEVCTYGWIVTVSYFAWI
jgi:intron-binding protein aquarius